MKLHLDLFLGKNLPSVRITQFESQGELKVCWYSSRHFYVQWEKNLLPVSIFILAKPEICIYIDVRKNIKDMITNFMQKSFNAQDIFQDTAKAGEVSSMWRLEGINRNIPVICFCYYSCCTGLWWWIADAVLSLPQPFHLWLRSGSDRSQKYRFFTGFASF